ncbi:hypothetical protein K504DRAFT_430133 [Pleomassaria siparia CBS 279.74]|uniref:Kinetochore protein fta4 n=1 Tax=Pleomassaria siparia CBS 279.74 TaxID=1314801 RepID=A0A6G1KB37_9PLEO|nr:hypothetical protein K504DRAFT_430133 [Pleomassaria siparia CBS 279.74]
MSMQNTVVDRKRKFLQLQKQILKKGIPATHQLVTIANQGGIPSRVLTDVLRKVNRDLSRHSRLVHSRQMTEHVVEAIDDIYWEAAAVDLEGETDAEMDTATGLLGEENSTLYQNDDLTLDKNISKLPPTWDDSDEYMSASVRLQSLSAKRLTLEQRLNTYQALLSLLEPYRMPKKNIQPNLVGRDSPLATELGKTRTLVFRVAGRVHERFGDDVQVPATEEEQLQVLETGEEGRKKLEAIMKGW